MTYIEDLDLSVRSYNLLKHAGINTLEKLQEMSEEELRNVKYLGPKSYKEILKVRNNYVEENTLKWIPISEKLPPLGICVMCTVKDHYNGQLELRYPVYYLQKTYESGYAFYFGDTNNPLLPNVSEVVAWMPLPEPYEAETENED